MVEVEKKSPHFLEALDVLKELQRVLSCMENVPVKEEYGNALAETAVLWSIFHLVDDVREAASVFYFTGKITSTIYDKEWGWIAPNFAKDSARFASHFLNLLDSEEEDDVVMLIQFSDAYINLDSYTEEENNILMDRVSRKDWLDIVTGFATTIEELPDIWESLSSRERKKVIKDFKKYIKELV